MNIICGRYNKIQHDVIFVYKVSYNIQSSRLVNKNEYKRETTHGNCYAFLLITFIVIR